MGLLRAPNVAVITSGTNDWNTWDLFSRTGRGRGLAPKQYSMYVDLNLHRR
jgi:hypothetical protein